MCAILYENFRIKRSTRSLGASVDVDLCVWRVTGLTTLAIICKAVQIK